MKLPLLAAVRQVIPYAASPHLYSEGALRRVDELIRLAYFSYVCGCGGNLALSTGASHKGIGLNVDIYRLSADLSKPCFAIKLEKD